LYVNVSDILHAGFGQLLVLLSVHDIRENILAASPKNVVRCHFCLDDNIFDRLWFRREQVDLKIVRTGRQIVFDTVVDVFPERVV
jgi:hypothetical protein